MTSPITVALLGCGSVGSQVTGLLGQQPHHVRPDHAAAQHGDVQRIHSRTPRSVASRSSTVSRRTIVVATPSRTATTGGRSAWL